MNNIKKEIYYYLMKENFTFEQYLELSDYLEIEFFVDEWKIEPKDKRYKINIKANLNSAEYDLFLKKINELKKINSIKAKAE